MKKEVGNCFTFCRTGGWGSCGSCGGGGGGDDIHYSRQYLIVVIIIVDVVRPATNFAQK